MDSARELLDRYLSALLGPRHVGMLVPWANTVIEDEMPRLGGRRLRWHYARLVPNSRTTGLDGPFIDGLVEAIPDALDQLAKLPLEATCFGCTSASAVRRDIAARRGAALISAFDAIVRTLDVMHAQKLVLLAPYVDEITTHEANQLAAAGKCVLSWRTLGLSDRFDLVDSRQVIGTMADLVKAIRPKDIDATVVSCTNLPTLDLLPELERITGGPVVSSNLAMAIAAADASAR